MNNDEDDDDNYDDDDLEVFFFFQIKNVQIKLLFDSFFFYR